MVGPEILVGGAIFQHVIDRGEDRRRHRAGGLLRTAAALETIKLRLKVAAVLAPGGPGALDQQRLQPWGALAQARGPALAGTLVVARTEPGPRHEVSGGWKAAHVAPD